MRLFLRRIIIIIILLLVGYLIYGRVNPSGAEKMKIQLQNLDLPRQQAKERAAQLMIREVKETDNDEVSEKEDGEEVVSDTLTGEDKRVKQEQENTNDNTELRNYLEAELKKADQEKAQQDTRAEGEAEANVVINADNGELTDEDLNEIKALLNSLLEE